MNRRFLILAAFAVWAQCSAVWAQIIVEPEHQPGTLIHASYGATPPPGAMASYDWTWSDGLDARIVEDGRGLLATGLSGRYKIGVSAQFKIKVFTPSPEFPDDPTKAILTDLLLPPYVFERDVTILGERPAPVVQPLAVLAGKDAQKLGTLYAALAPQTVSITSAASFKIVHAKLLADQGLTNNGAAAAIDKRLAPVLTPFDAGKLKSVLEEFVAELGSLPPPIPVVEGKRRVVILHETGDNTPELSQLFIKLRRQDVDQYLAEKGHLLDILDDDQKTATGELDPTVVKLKATGEALPALFILDRTTGELVHKQPLPSTPEAVMEALKTHGG